MTDRNPNLHMGNKHRYDRVWEPDYMKSPQLTVVCQLCDRTTRTGSPSCDPFDEVWVLNELLGVHNWQRVDVAGKQGLIRVWRCPDHHVQLPDLPIHDDED